MRASILVCMIALMSLGAAGCARQQIKFETLEKRDRLRFAACRHDVVRYLCPDDPDCDVKAAEMYSSEPATSRRQWLIDYRCPRDKIQHVDDQVRGQERESIGMPAE